MNAIVFHLASLSAKIILLGGVAWIQLFLLRRAPASSRSRLCSVALLSILLLGAGEIIAPNWMLRAPIYNLTVTSTAAASPVSGSGPAISGLALLWLVGVAFMLFRAIVGRTALSIVRRRSILLEEACGVELRIAAVRTPVLAGWLHPTILLPEAARAWTVGQRSIVLTHELTHFRQGDIWTNLFAQIIRAVFWFHPVVWLLVSRLSREQELTCDEAVVASGHSRHDYAAFLLDNVRDLRSSELFACAMAGSGAKSLQRRFANLLDPTPRPVTRRIAVSLASFALIATALTVVRPVWSQNDRKVYKVGGGVTAPKVLKKVDPQYTPEDKDAKVEGPVVLKLIITEEGTAESIEVVKSLSPGLDQKAIDAVSQWTFQPGTKDGQAVAVWATIEVNFRLK